MDDGRICNDILIEVFLRVPPKSVFRFKCLSKYWRDRLSDNAFRKRYKSMRILSSSSLLPLSGLFHGFRRHISPEPSKLCFAPTCKQSMLVRSSKVIHTLGFFLGYSNGLLLCGFLPSNYYVCNPITDQYVELPQPHNNICDPKHGMIGFLYEEDEHDTNRPTYTIIRADCRRESRNVLPTETYSSDSGVWTESLLKGAADFRLLPQWPCRVVRGIFYWVATEPGMLIARDSKAKHEWIWQIHLLRGWYPFNNILGESTTDGFLLLGMNGFPGIRIARLRKQVRDYSPHMQVPSSEWIHILHVNYGLPLELYVIDGLPCLKIENSDYPSLIGFHPQSSRFILMRFNQILFWYDLETEESTSIWCLPLPFLEDDVEALIPYFHPEWPPTPHACQLPPNQPPEFTHI